MPPVGDDPVARGARPAAAPHQRRPPRAPELHRRPDGDSRPTAADRPAPKRIERNGTGDGGLGRPQRVARSASRAPIGEKDPPEEASAPRTAGLSMPPVGDDPVARGARPAASTHQRHPPPSGRALIVAPNPEFWQAAARIAEAPPSPLQQVGRTASLAAAPRRARTRRNRKKETPLNRWSFNAACWR